MRVKIKSNYEINKAGFGIQQSFESQELATLIDHNTGIAVSIHLTRAKEGLTIVDNDTLTREAYIHFLPCFDLIDSGK